MIFRSYRRNRSYLYPEWNAIRKHILPGHAVLPLPPEFVRKQMRMHIPAGGFCGFPEQTRGVPENRFLTGAVRTILAGDVRVRLRGVRS